MPGDSVTRAIWRKWLKSAPEYSIFDLVDADTGVTEYDFFNGEAPGNYFFHHSSFSLKFQVERNCPHVHCEANSVPKKVKLFFCEENKNVQFLNVMYSK